MENTIGKGALALLAVLVVLLASCFAAAPASAGTAEQINDLPVLDGLSRSESPLSNGGEWSALGWANKNVTGRVAEGGWSPSESLPAINGAYWNQATFDDAGGSAAAITMPTGPGLVERYVSLWLDMPSPGSARTGYQLRWRVVSGTNAYKVTLSKWSAGTETILAEQASTEIAPGSTLAISDTGSTVTAWKGSGGSLTSILTASDSAFSSGYAGIEGSGTNSRSKNFKAGALGSPPLPETTISGGPTGFVVPNPAFSFTATPAGSGFECSLDGGAYGVCSSPQTYQGLAEGPHTFRVRGTNASGADKTPATRSFQVVEAAKAVTKVPGHDNFEREEVPLATGKWTKSSWTSEIGGAWCCFYYRGYGSSGGLAGAYWNPTSFSEGGETVLVAGKVGSGSPAEGEYLGLWLDMPSPNSARSGYEARFIGVNGSASNYKVELSKWVSGTRTILASTSGFSLPAGTRIALTQTAGGSLGLWTGSSSLSPLLTANDSTYASGYAGLEVNGPNGTIYDFRAGRIDMQPPETLIFGGPSGTVSPQSVSFTFFGDSGSSFECSMDGGPYSACSSPKSYPSLAPGSHTFRVRAIDVVGNQDPTPAERSFQIAQPPSAATNPATGIESGEATLHGSVNPNGIATTYQFEYGTTTAYGKTAPAAAKSVGSGSQAVAVSELTVDLEPETTYHFRIKATNGSGTTYGSDETFTTDPPPPVNVLAFGQAAESSPGSLVSPQQPLSIIAGDKGGKIKEIQLRVDGVTESTFTREEVLGQGGTESCVEGVCSLSYEYPSIFAPDLTPGQHTFEVRAIGESGEAIFTKPVLVDAALPTLSLSGSLVEAQGKVTSGSATVTVGAQEGNGAHDSGLKSIEFYVDGVYQSGLSNPCSGGCPAESSSSYQYQLTKWGSGPHELTIIAKDAAGSENSETIMVNQSVASVEPTCSTDKPTSAPVGKSVSTTEAVKTIETILPAAVAPTIPDPEAEEFEPTLVEGKAASESAEAFLARGGLVGGRIVRGADLKFTVGQATCLIPMQTTEAESAPEALPAAGAIAYANTAPETDTFVRNNGVGSTVVQSFRGPNAPTSLSWAVTLKSGQWLEELEGGAVAVVSSKGIDLPEAQLQSPPSGMEDPKKLADTATVLDAASYQLRKANNEVEEGVEAVIPPTLVVASNGAVQKVPLTVSGGDQVVASVPTGAKAMVVQTYSSPRPEAMCAAAFEEDQGNYVSGCLPDKEELVERTYITSVDRAPDGSFVYTAAEEESKNMQPWYIPDFFRPGSGLFRASEDGTEANELEVEEFEVEGFEVLGSVQVSPDGTKIAFNGCSLVSFECGVVLASQNGEEGTLVTTTEGHGNESWVSFSGDGSRLLYEKPTLSGPYEFEERQIYSMKLDGSGHRQLTNLSTRWAITTPTESWEGRGANARSAVAADPTSSTLLLEGSNGGIYAMSENQEKVDYKDMTRLIEFGSVPTFNPAGTKIAYYHYSGPEGSGVYTVNKDGSGKKRALSSPSSNAERAWHPAFSGNGSEIAFLRNGLVMNGPASGGKATVAIEPEVTGDVTLAEAVAKSDPDPTHLPVIEAAEADYLVSYDDAMGAIEDGLDVLEEMNRWEMEFCSTRLGECKAFYDDRQLATAAMHALFTNRNKGKDSTRANAFLHSFWTALLIKSSKDLYKGYPTGLMYSLHHENKPFSKDARMDIVNDFVGYFWYLKNGLETTWTENDEVHFHRQNKLELCQGFLPKAKNAIFIGGKTNAFKWVSKNDYEFGRVLFRKLRASDGSGPKIWANGRTCADVWAAITD